MNDFNFHGSDKLGIAEDDAVFLARFDSNLSLEKHRELPRAKDWGWLQNALGLSCLLALCAYGLQVISRPENIRGFEGLHEFINSYGLSFGTFLIVSAGIALGFGTTALQWFEELDI